MRNNDKTAYFRHALQHVQQRRFCINPNEGFTNQLSEYEPIYKARLTLEKGQPSQDKGVLRLKSWKLKKKINFRFWYRLNCCISGILLIIQFIIIYILWRSLFVCKQFWRENLSTRMRKTWKHLDSELKNCNSTLEFLKENRRLYCWAASYVNIIHHGLFCKV